jgi:hypothetical protein
MPGHPVFAFLAEKQLGEGPANAALRQISYAVNAHSAPGAVMHEPVRLPFAPPWLALGAAGAILLGEARRMARWNGRPPLRQET